MGFGFDVAPMKVTFYEPEFDFFKNSPNGEVGRNMDKKMGRPIFLAAKRDVGVDTGNLLRSMYMIHERKGAWQQIRIGARDKIALIHHEGSRAHNISARPPEMLRFSSRGRMVYTRHVRHPGTRANRFLSDNLYLAYV